jgi:putative ABC transport system ATP-binding protein
VTVPEGPTAAEAGHEPAATAEGTGTAVAIAVELRGASCHYRTPAGVVRAVDDIDLQVRTGECVAVMGPSGSGKSTLLALLGGLEQASSGTVEVLGTDWSTLSSEGRARFRRQNVGFVFQDLGLLPFLTAAENVAFGAGLSGASTTLDPREVLEHLGLTTQLDRLPDQLSGGERGRVAIGRGLAHKPRLVLGDEPTGSLDAEASDLTITYFLQAARGLGSTAVVVTHDPDVAARFDRTVLLRDGHVVGDPPASTPGPPPGPTPGPPPASTPAPTPAPPPAPTPGPRPEAHPAHGSEAGSTDGSGSV